LQGVKIGSINIGTEQVQAEGGQINVSTIEVTLKK